MANDLSLSHVLVLGTVQMTEVAEHSRRVSSLTKLQSSTRYGGAKLFNALRNGRNHRKTTHKVCTIRTWAHQRNSGSIMRFQSRSFIWNSSNTSPGTKSFSCMFTSANTVKETKTTTAEWIQTKTYT